MAPSVRGERGFDSIALMLGGAKNKRQYADEVITIGFAYTRNVGGLGVVLSLHGVNVIYVFINLIYQHVGIKHICCVCFPFIHNRARLLKIL